MKRAFLFPGQGAQIVGMGKEIYEKYVEARNVYEKVKEITNLDIQKICFEGPEEELNKTQNTQIAVLTTSLAILEILKAHHVEADVAVGLSLGEYTALVYSGILTIEDGIKLVQKRGYYMANLLPKEEYAMAAVIGLDSEKIENICNEISENGKFIVPANYNCKIQTAISGEKLAIEEATEKLKLAGARKVIQLKTSGPFHTQKLEKAKNEYSKELENVHFNTGKINVIKNIDGNYYNKNDDIREILASHITNPVRFDKAIELMKNEGIEEYIEVGPGRVLTGFIKKDIKDANVYNINDLESLEYYINKI